MQYEDKYNESLIFNTFKRTYYRTYLIIKNVNYIILIIIIYINTVINYI